MPEPETHAIEFGDQAYEGWLAWQLSMQAGAPPFLLSAQHNDSSRNWWRRAERRVEVVAETSLPSPYRTGEARLVLYRTADPRAFDSVVFRASYDGELPEFVPGTADPSRVLGAFAKNIA